MSAHALARLAIVTFLIVPVPALAQQGPRIDVLTGEPVRPRREHPRPEPEIFNAPHAPRQEQRRADDPPIEIYVTPQMSDGTQQDPYATRRLPPPLRLDRRWDGGLPR